MEIEFEFTITYEIVGQALIRSAFTSSGAQRGFRGVGFCCITSREFSKHTGSLPRAPRVGPQNEAKAHVKVAQGPYGLSADECTAHDGAACVSELLPVQGDLYRNK